MRLTSSAMLAAVIGLALSGCASTGSDSGSGDSPGTPEATANAKKVLADFEANEASADRTYQDKTLEISGRVAKVDTDLLDDESYIVNVGSGGRFEILTVNCNGLSSDDVVSVKKGQRITVVGTVSDGGDLGVELDPCEIK